MDDPPSDGNERVADIFIISTDETVAVPLEEHLGKKDYRVTVFTDDAKLNETIPARIPDLLICDTTTGKQEGYDLIRRIKADENQWGIPVLVLTAASTVEDLLNVLESNADNFIAPPYDLPDNLSLIEGMLTTPVEQPTRYEAERQFRVRYDDKTYLVPAISRKILEFLLSSFDILVRTSSQLSSVTTELQALAASATRVEQTIAGQTQANETLHATVRQNEQKIMALTREGEDLKTLLEKKANEVTDLTAESDALRQQVGKLQETLTSSTKALEAERELRRVSEENTKAALQRQGDLEKRTRRSTEELERVQKDQAEVVSQIKEELKEASRQVQSLESEVSTLAAEKLHAGQEVRTLTASATELEQTIAGQTQANETLHATVRQNEQKIMALTREGEDLKTLLEKKANELTDLEAESDALRQQVGKLQETLTSSTKALEAERELRRVSEENTVAALQRQEDLEKHTRRSTEELERVQKDQAEVVSQIKEELKEASRQIQSLESEVSTLAAEKLHAEQEVRTLTAELVHTRTTLAHGNESHPGNDEGSADTGKERHMVQQPLFSAKRNIPIENLDLVMPEGSNLPTPVNQVARQIASESAPGQPPLQPLVSEKDLVTSEQSGKIPSLFSGVISRLPGISDPDSIFLVHEPDAKKEDMAPEPTKVHNPTVEKTVEAYSQEESSAVPGQLVQPAFVC